MVVMPGLVDSHVHVNEPGGPLGRDSAPPPRPPRPADDHDRRHASQFDSPDRQRRRPVREEAAAEGKLWVDVAFWGGFIPGSENQIGPLVAEGVSGFESFLVESG